MALAFFRAEGIAQSRNTYQKYHLIVERSNFRRFEIFTSMLLGTDNF